MNDEGDRPYVEFTPERRAIFLDRIRQWPNVTAAARAAGVFRRTPYTYAEKHKDFAEEWEQAKAEGVDKLEEEGLRRAQEGVPRVKVSKGEVVLEPVCNEDGTIKYDAEGRPIMRPLIEMQYSDTIWCRLMEAHRPEQYRQKQETNVQFGGGATLNLIEAKDK